MSADMGINLSHDQFARRVGSIVCVGLGYQIPGLLPGLRENIDFSFQATLTNTTYFDHSKRSLYDAHNTAARAPPAASAIRISIS